MSATIAYFSLGSNLGDRLKNIYRATDELRRAGVEIVRSSSIYETEPQDLLEQPSFFNCVLEGLTELSPFALVEKSQMIEESLGRKRGGIAKGPRYIDIDILLFDEVILDHEDLKIPHPRMQHRRFVLEPLIELAPELRNPQSGQLWADFLPGVSGQGVARIGEPLAPKNRR